MGSITLSVTLESVAPQSPQYPDGIKYTLRATDGLTSCFNFDTQNLDFSGLPPPPPGQTLEVDIIFHIASSTVPYPYANPTNVSVGWNVGNDPNDAAGAITIRLGNNTGPVSTDGEFACSFVGGDLKVADADNNGDAYYYSLNFLLGTSPTPTLVRFDPEVQNHPA